MPETLFLFDSPPIYPALTRWTKGTPLAATVLKMHSHEVFRQNSRTREYMMNAASAAFPGFSVSTVLGPEDLDGVDWSGVQRIVLLWPDSNGLGWRPVEQKVLRSVRPGTEVTVLNGRRRTFQLARAPQLYVRRFLEKSFLPDLLFTAGFFVATPFLLAADLIRGKS